MDTRRSSQSTGYWQGIRLALLLCVLLCHSIPLPVRAQSSITAALSGSTKRTSQSADELVERGATLLDEGAYEEAIGAFTEALALDANHTRAYALRGQAYWLNNELDQALTDLNQAIALAPEDADAYGTRGAVYADLGRYPEAIADYDEALRLDPNNVWTLAHRGYAAYLHNDNEAALVDLNSALRLNPQYGWAIVARGETYNNMAEYDKALLDLTRALSLEPDNAWGLAMRGSTYRALGEYDKAIADLSRAVELSPTYSWAQTERGRTYEEMGDPEQALADYEAVIQREPTYDWAWVRRGMLYFDHAQYAEALTDFNQAIQLDSTYDWALAYRGQTYQALEAYATALDDFTAAIEINPTYGWYYALRADLLRIMEQYEEALADANQAVDLTPDDEFAWGVRGYVYRMMENYEAAVADFTQAIVLEPTYSWAYTMRGELYQLLEREEEALADFEEANRLNSVNDSSTSNAVLTPEPTPIATTAPLAVSTAALTTADAADTAGAVQSLADAQQAVIQIEAVGSFSSPREEGPSIQAGQGTGFIIDPSGIAVTNNHVVTGGALFKVYIEGQAKARNARVLGVSECADLAVIDIEGEGFPYLSWYEGDINVGLDVYAAGYPLGDPEYTLTRGIIAKARANGQTAWSSLDHVLQHDADINPGNSGGPLLTAQGQVVGVNYAINAEFRQSFAIGRAEALPIIEQLRLGQDVDALGINGEAYSDGADTHGIWVSSVQSGSPAEQAGVQGGDFILSLENIGMAGDGTMQAYCEVVRSHGAADTLAIEIYRRATGELCSGQLNGRALTCQPATEDNTPQVGESYRYIRITDHAGQLSFEAPESWVDHGAGDWLFDEQPHGTWLAASPNLKRSFENWDTPAIYTYVSQDLVGEMTMTELLNRYDFSEQCIGEQPVEITQGVYKGVARAWNACGDNKTVLISVAFQPATQAFVGFMLLHMTDQQDSDVLRHVLDTLEVNFEAKPPPAPTATWGIVEGRLKQVAIGCDGTVWGVNAADGIFRRDGEGWTQIDGGLINISVGNAHAIWGVNRAGDIYRWLGDRWEAVPGKLKQVAVGCDGAIWGVNAVDEIFRRDGENWSPIEGRLTQIAVGNAQQVWGVNADGAIFKREGNAWTQVEGGLNQVAVGHDGTVWGVNANQEIYHLVEGQWLQIEGTLTQIAVGDATYVWGVNADQLLYSWGSTPAFAKVQHESGLVELLAPPRWQTVKSSTTAKGDLILSATDPETGSGMLLDVLTNIDRSTMDIDQLLAVLREGTVEGEKPFFTNCQLVGNEPYTDAYYQGSYERWTQCDDGFQLVQLVTMPKDNRNLLVALLVFVPDNTAVTLLSPLMASIKVKQEAVAAPAGATAVVGVETLNIRNGPGTGYGLIGQSHQGNRLPVVAQAYNCAWLQVQLPDSKQGWIAGQAPYATLEGNCAELPQGKIPPAPVASGGSGGNGCILFQNSFNDEATVTLTSKDGKWNKTFKIGRKANTRECLAPGSYTYTVDVPPPWGSINGELDIQRGRTITFPIYGN